MTDTPSPDEPHVIRADDLRWQDCGDAPPPTSSPDEEAACHGPPLACTRVTKRQGTSYMAFRGEEPATDDPLLDFKPVPHERPRRNSITAERQRAFIAHLAATGIVTEAARHIGASMEALYKLRKRPGGEEFDAAWDGAVDRGVARLEDTALARAIEGEERLVVSAGKLIGTERRHNEALVMFFLKNRRAMRYGAEVRPGHPLYERIRGEVLAELRQTATRDEESILASIDAKLALIRDREAAAQRLLVENGGIVF